MTLSALQDALMRLDASIDAERRAVDAQRRLLAKRRSVAVASQPAAPRTPDDFAVQRTVLAAHQGALARLVALRDRVCASIHDAKAVQ